MKESIGSAKSALKVARTFEEAVRKQTAAVVIREGRFNAEIANKEQRRLHGLAWISTTVAALAALCDWAEKLQLRGKATTIDKLVLTIGFGEYLSQLYNGVVMSQNEFVRPLELGVEAEAVTFANHADVRHFLSNGNTSENRSRLVAELRETKRPSEELDDETLDMMRAQIRNFVTHRIAPHAHTWHLENRLIPIEVVEEMAELGIFGVCIDAKYGGLGLNKLTMSVVSEELSRGWICAGSLGTRSEIAGELISANGTKEQKQNWLPAIADGSVLPTAVFTEPDVGSDLASVSTRGVIQEDGSWLIKGAKNWITHAARADLMTLLVRTNPKEKGYAGLSILLAPKTRGTDVNPFPDEGIDGSEIEVLGYRGMKEYCLSFDDFKVAADSLLAAEEGQGFKQLMATFEGARIQTAARAVGVGWNAFELALKYSLERRQFGSSLIDFPRIADKLALMAVEQVCARELTYFAAREKDQGHRCDIQAGMAKLLAARVAWANADLNVQIHGGNGYALECEASRLLCDARILNIFEGAAEIQAHVVGRGLLQS